MVASVEVPVTPMVPPTFRLVVIYALRAVRPEADKLVVEAVPIKPLVK